MEQVFDFFQRMADTSDWPPRWRCGRWTDFHGWLYIMSDLTIWLAYMVIPLILIRFIFIKKGVPLAGVFWLFGAFILFCGLSHLMDAAMFWIPAYRINALIRFLTAVVSVATVIALIRYFNEAVGLRTSKEYDHELSYRQLALQELTRSNQELQQFAYIASHDLQSPLKTIAGYLSLLETKHGNQLDTDARRIIGVSIAASERMRNLINDVLDFSRIGIERSFTQVNLKQLVNEILEEQRSEILTTGAKLEIDPLPTITGHRTDLKQLFQNLISNALKYHRANVPPFIQIHATEDFHQYQFSISDNGIGINNQHFDRIFQIFQRLHGRNKYSGNGIGLATCKKVIDIYGGQIWLKSTVDSGTTVYFSIPKEIKTLHQFAQANSVQSFNERIIRP